MEGSSLGGTSSLSGGKGYGAGNKGMQKEGDSELEWETEEESLVS